MVAQTFNVLMLNFNVQSHVALLFFLFENLSDPVRDIKSQGILISTQEISISKQQKFAVCGQQVKYKATSCI